MLLFYEKINFSFKGFLCVVNWKIFLFLLLYNDLNVILCGKKYLCLYLSSSIFVWCISFLCFFWSGDLSTCSFYRFVSGDACLSGFWIFYEFFFLFIFLLFGGSHQIPEMLHVFICEKEIRKKRSCLVLLFVLSSIFIVFC